MSLRGQRPSRVLRVRKPALAATLQWGLASHVSSASQSPTGGPRKSSVTWWMTEGWVGPGTPPPAPPLSKAPLQTAAFHQGLRSQCDRPPEPFTPEAFCLWWVAAERVASEVGRGVGRGGGTGRGRGRGAWTWERPGGLDVGGAGGTERGRGRGPGRGRGRGHWTWAGPGGLDVGGAGGQVTACLLGCPSTPPGDPQRHAPRADCGPGGSEAPCAPRRAGGASARTSGQMGRGPRPAARALPRWPWLVE